jgi:hypothetical protein
MRASGTGASSVQIGRKKTGHFTLCRDPSRGERKLLYRIANYVMVWNILTYNKPV